METLLEIGFDLEKIKKIKNKKVGYFMYFCYTIMQKYSEDKKFISEIAYELNIDVVTIENNAKQYKKAQGIVQELGFDLQEIRATNKGNKDFEYFCLTLYNKYASNSSVLNLMADVLEMNVQDIPMYADRYKREDDVDYRNPFRAISKRDTYIKNGYGKRFEEVVKKLLTSNNKDELNEYLYENLNLMRDKRSIVSYVINMYPNNTKHVFEIINSKLKDFSLFLHQKKEEQKEEKRKEFYEEIKQHANFYQKQIMRDGTSKSFYDFTTKNKIDRNVMNECIEIWKQKKENGKCVYDILIEKFNTNRKNYYDQFNDLIDKVLPLVNKYIKVGDTVRKFDIIDCFTYFGMDLSSILSTLIENYSHYSNNNEKDKEIIEQVAYLKKLIRDISANSTKLDTKDYHYSSVSLEKEFIEMEMKNKTIIQQDRLIDGHIEKVPYNVRSLEKEEIFDVLNTYGIPINTRNYNLMLRHLNNGRVEVITRENIDYLLKSHEKEGKRR